MRSRRLPWLGGLLLLLAPVLASDAIQARGRPKDRIPRADLPEWVREAAQRPVFEEGHDVTWLLVETLVEPLPDAGVRITARRAGKVVRDPGREALGSTTVFYRDEDEVVSLKAWNILPDGTVRAAKPARDVHDRPAISGYSVYDDVRVRTIAAPGVQVGSIVASENVKLQGFDTGAYPFYFGSLDAPTVESRFTLRVPEGWRWDAVQRRTEDTGIELTQRDDGFTLSGSNLVSQPREELRPAFYEIVPMVWGRWWSPDGKRGYEDWNAVARWYEKLSAPVLEEAGEAAEIGARLDPAGPEELKASLTEAFAFAARQVRYVSIQIGIGGYLPSSPADVCRLRYGDCKAKSFLMRALVGPWGLVSYPVLVRLRHTGPVAADVPSPNQFNHAIVAIVLPEDAGEDLWATLDVEGVGRVLFMDATANHSSPWELPDLVQGTSALLVTPDGGKLIRLPEQPPSAAVTTRRLEARIDADGALTEATLVESWTGNQASDIRHYYAGKPEDDRRRGVLEDLQDRFPGAVVEDYRIEGLNEVEAPVVETTRMTGGRLGKRVSTMLILEPARSGYGLLGTRLPPPPRRWPLKVGSPREERVDVSVELPTGWVPEELPEPLHLESGDMEVETEWAFAAGKLTYRRTARLLVSRVPPDRYASFRDALSRLQHERASAVVLVPR
jgi:hypothetical protein